MLSGFFASANAADFCGKIL